MPWIQPDPYFTVPFTNVQRRQQGSIVMISFDFRILVWLHLWGENCALKAATFHGEGTNFFICSFHLNAICYGSGTNHCGNIASFWALSSKNNLSSKPPANGPSISLSLSQSSLSLLKDLLGSDTLSPHLLQREKKRDVREENLMKDIGRDT